MLTYVLNRKDGEKKYYLYYPNGDKSIPGEIEISKNGERKVIAASKGDVKNYYAMHACAGIDLNKEQGIIAWY